MSPERKIFWAFAWLALLLIGLGAAARQVSVYVFVVPVPTLTDPEPVAPRRQRMMFDRTGHSLKFPVTLAGPVNGWRLVTTPAGGSPCSSRGVNRRRL